MLKKRIITSVWGLPLLGVIIWFGEPFFVAFVAIWALLALFEFYRLASGLKITPHLAVGVVMTLLFIGLRYPGIADIINPYFDFNMVVPLVFTAGTIISLILLLSRRQKLGAFNGWAWTMAGVLYIGWLLGYVEALRGMEDGRNWVFFALFCTFGSDTASFFIGKAFGKRKLAPSISPGKTWAGAIGGLFGTVAVSLLFLLNHPLSLSPHLNWWQAVILGLLISIFGQLGDLVESLLKRNTGVKDSGTLIPGHGGVLDRMDSVVFAVVVVYYWAICTIQ